MQRLHTSTTPDEYKGRVMLLPRSGKLPRRLFKTYKMHYSCLVLPTMSKLSCYRFPPVPLTITMFYIKGFHVDRVSQVRRMPGFYEQAKSACLYLRG